MEYLLGIDLGTTNCTVTAIDENGKTVVIRNRDGDFVTPSAVYFAEKKNTFIVGKRAKELAPEDTEGRLVTLVKREMGLEKSKVRFNRITQKCRPYSFWNKAFSPEEISSKILKQLKEDAETQLGERISKAVITCPDYFKQAQRDATKKAGEMAGLDVLEIITEPAAAALAYSRVSKKIAANGKERVFVFDLGGETFNATVIDLQKDEDGISITTKCTDGDVRLGGADWDNICRGNVIEMFNKKFGVEFQYEKGPEKERAKGLLTLDAEKLKKELSKPDVESAKIRMEYRGHTIEETYTRERYANVTRELWDKCRSKCVNLLKDASMTWGDIDTILMAGSMSNCLFLQDALRELSGKDILFGVIDPKTCVSQGAAIHAYNEYCDKKEIEADAQTPKESPETDYLLGIDLGTTNCSVTAIDGNGKATVIKNRDGEYITPSAVYFNTKKNSYTVGKRAIEQSAIDPANLVTLVKREMGKNRENVRFDKLYRKYRPYVFWGRTFSPEEISSKILAQLKRDAEKELGQEVRKAVITCPGYFGQNEKEATRLAGELAGLDVMEVITEPVAAALSYSTVSDKDNERIFVFDLGGGTFDVTIVKVETSPAGKKVEIECLDGNSRLGGADWDQLMVSHVVDAFKRRFQIDLYYEHTDAAARALGSLRLEVEKAKKTLSGPGCESVELSLSYDGKDFSERISRADFTKITRQPTDRCMDYCKHLLQAHGLSWNDIDTILMVGSMSNCFSIQEALRDLCGHEVSFGIVNPKTCVSEGAAIKAYYNQCEKEGRRAVVQTLAEKPDYDKAEGDAGRLAQIAEAEKDGKRIATSIDSARSALPASISLKGHKAGKDFAKKLLMKDESYPVEKSMDVPLGSDGMAEVSIVVMEGESDAPADCLELGKAVLPLEGQHLSKDKVKVTFSIDLNGIIQVSGVDLKTGKSVSAEIRRNNAISEQEKQEIMEQAEEDDFTF